MEDALCSSRWFRVGAFAGRRFGAGTFPPRFRRGRRRAAAGIDLQAHPSGYAVAAQSIPPLQFRNADVELLSNGIERISPADPIVNQLAQHGLRVRRGRNNQFVAGVQWGAGVDAVGIGDGGGGHAVLSRDRAGSLTLSGGMAAISAKKRSAVPSGRRSSKLGSLGVTMRSNCGLSDLSVSTSTSMVSATSRRSIGWPGLTGSERTGDSGSTWRPYRCASLATRVRARMIGT